MTRPEAEAYNEGVRAVLALARGAADRLAPKYPDKPRLSIAIGALDGLAEEGTRLLRRVDDDARG